MASSKVDHPFLRVQLVVAGLSAIVGVIVCSVAGYLASKVSKYGDPRYATYWMGIASIVIFLLLIFVQYMIKHQRPRAKLALVVWIVVVAAGAVFSLISLGTLADKASTIDKANKQNCVYIDKTGTYKRAREQRLCEEQCRRGLQDKTGSRAPARTCCCCKQLEMTNGYKIFYAKDLPNCEIMFGTVLDSLVALAVLYAVLACLFIALTALGIITVRGCRGYASVFDSSTNQSSKEHRYNPYQ